jgi:hypothetical protein
MERIAKDRRQYERFKVNGGLLLYNKDLYAEILDISPGGLLCTCRAGRNKLLFADFEMDLLDKSTGRFLSGLSGEIRRRTTHHKITPDRKKESYMVGVAFKNLTKEKLEQLTVFMKNSTGKGCSGPIIRQCF